MSSKSFLLINLAFAFYNTGTIWADEVDIFRSWKYLAPNTFKAVQTAHWKKLPFWVFIPVGLSTIGSVALFWYHPHKIPLTEISIAFALLFLSNLFTAIYWGPLQAKLSRAEEGGASEALNTILKTHWIRTALITAYGLMLLLMTCQILKR